MIHAPFTGQRSAWLPGGGREATPGRCKPSCCKTPLGHANPTPVGCSCHHTDIREIPVMPDYTVEMNDDDDRDELPWVTCYMGHPMRAFATKLEADEALASKTRKRALR